MTNPDTFTEEQKQNIASVLRRALEITAARRREAVASGDIQRSIAIANNEAQMTEQFRVRGIPVPECP